MILPADKPPCPVSEGGYQVLGGFNPQVQTPFSLTPEIETANYPALHPPLVSPPAPVLTNVQKPKVAKAIPENGQRKTDPGISPNRKEKYSMQGAGEYCIDVNVLFSSSQSVRCTACEMMVLWTPGTRRSYVSIVSHR